MSDVTITHPLALDETPDRDPPRRVTVERDGTQWKELVREDGTFDGTSEKLHELAGQYDVAPERLTDDGRIVG